MEHRVYNFAAGPAALPEPVLYQLRQELLNHRGSGMSVMELSHRGAGFRRILEEAEADLRQLMHIPAEYRVLFLQGGGTQQFAMVPMNLARGEKADYIRTGTWSEKAYQEAGKFLDAGTAAQTTVPFTIPAAEEVRVRPDARYLYICENETVQGTQYNQLPKVTVPIVSDQSSMFLSEPCVVTNYGLIFAGAQKNVGPAGLAIVIVQKELIRKDPSLPASMSYALQDEAGSLYNTPNCWSIYVCGKVFRYLLDCGGLDAVKLRNEAKSRMLYHFLDHSKLFRPLVTAPWRSGMNVTFTTGSHTMDQKLIHEAENEGFVGLAGHKSQGGLRASLYNAVTLDAVRSLCQFLKRFEHKEASLSSS